MNYESESIEALKIDMLAVNKELARIRKRLEPSELRVIHQSDRYRLVVERAASTKGVDGFKVEVNGDDIEAVRKDADDLYNYAKDLTMILGKTIMVESQKAI